MNMRISVFAACAGFWVVACVAQTQPDSDVSARTILDKNCLGCHGAAKMGGLDIRERATMLQGGGRGPGLVPGNAGKSLIYLAVTRSTDLKMPPGKKALSSAYIEKLKTWIDEGAKWDTGSDSAPGSSAAPDWWSLRKLKRPAVPEANGAVNAPTNPVDAFVLSKLKEKGLKPVLQADRRTLIRRAFFDLHGLPPSPKEVDDFLADATPDAYPKLIDRLLASPRYGERWGRHWLDVARYADTGGFETDIYFPNAWRYRDYVIDSFNQDKPYNRFVQEQIAGDELWPDDLDLDGGFEIPKQKQEHLAARIGTGMYTIGPVYHEAALFGGQLRYEWLTDVVDTTGEAFLGLTFGCARCHDHKFDPISQRDYHGMMAVFAGSEEREVPVVSKFSVFGFKSGYTNYLRVEELKGAIRRIEEIARKRVVDKIRSNFSSDILTAYDIPQQTRTPDQRTLAARLEKALTEAGLQENAEGKVADIPYTAGESKERERLLAELGQAALNSNSVLPTATVLSHADVVPEIRIAHRGDWRSVGDKVAPAFPAVLTGGKTIEEPEGRPLMLQRRKALALWLTEPDHPLTARVVTNRIWHWHFGRGIVGTPSDFGRQGDEPTHPELLDWLASELVANNWSIKKLHRLIMTSDTYMRSSTNEPANTTIDANNRFLWRMNRTRADSETLRDSVLAVSGQMNLKMGGKPVVPPLSKEEYSVLWARNQWPESLDAREHGRRSVYMYVKRTFPMPMLSTFDSPDTSISCARRDSTTVAPQALTLMNGEFMNTGAKEFAARLQREHGSQPDQWVDAAWRLTLGRPPSEAEKERALRSFSAGASAKPSDDLTRLCLVLFNMNEFLYVD
ncbi:MAG: PSD1 domain-containing protein [Bryobacteraceae bacterium]|nr:PSD1 domain-containing protein [Bryobacteraceae bacterium]